MTAHDERREGATDACGTLLERLAIHGPLPVTTVDLRYEDGDYVAWSGVQGGGPRGYGRDSAPVPSKLFVIVVTPAGERLKIRIDRVFKGAIDRLSSQRRDLIRRVMPLVVTIMKADDPWYGKEQILLSDQDSAAWIERVRAALPRRKRRKSA